MRLTGTDNFRAIGICAAIAVGTSLGVLAPPALAAPANDAFANRTDLGATLPVHLEESNAEATRDGLVEIDAFAKGHSIWWEWEAPTTGWTTVDTCDSAFPTVVGIFEGTELQHLTSLSSGNATEGPQCLARGTTHTFRAESGKSYDIAADGNGFYPPMGELPSGEGTIKLSIEATPPPPNDAFADATPVSATIYEEPSGRRRYYTQVPGYDWGATVEAGEPAIGAAPAAASVWYSWTPPESGEATISDCCSPPTALELFRGNSPASLVPVPAIEPYAGSLHAQVVGGTEYRIGVAALEDETTGEPAMSSFNLAVGLGLPPGPGYPWEPTGEETVTPPTVTTTTTSTPNAPVYRPPVAARSLSVDLGAHGVDAVKRTATFRFHASVGGATFTCKVDDQASKACRSPFKVGGLRPGKHRLEVVAAAPERTASAPAILHFAVPAPQRRGHQAG